MLMKHYIMYSNWSLSLMCRTRHIHATFTACRPDSVLYYMNINKGLFIYMHPTFPCMLSE